MQEEIRKKLQMFKPLPDVNIVLKDNQNFVFQVNGKLFSDKVYIYLSNLNGEVFKILKWYNAVGLAVI